MDWQKIWTLLDVFLKAQGVPHTDKIRQRALEELEICNTESEQEELDLDAKREARRV